MTVRVGFSEDAGIAGSPGQIVARIGVCSRGAVGTVYEFAGGQQGSVPEALGYGPLAATEARGSLYGRNTSLAIPAAVATPGTVSSVTQTGGGPAATCAALIAAGEDRAGPWFTFPSLTLEIVTAGGLGVARANVLYDGYTVADTIELPAELPASTFGTVDITALSGAQLSALNTKTFIVNPDGNGPFTTTFSAVTAYQDIIDQIQASMRNAATALGTADLTSYTPSDINGKTLIFTSINSDGVGATVTFSAVSTLANIATQIAAVTGVTSSLAAGDFIRITSDVLGDGSEFTLGNGTANADLGFTNGQTATGNQYGSAALVGGKYLQLTAETGGSSGTLVIGAGTANADLGFAAGTINGVNSTYTPPGTGVRWTFPAGSYEKGTTYAVATEAPRMSLAGMQAAATALRLDGAAFAILHVVHEPADGLDLAAWQAALEELRLAWATAEENPIFVKWVIGSPLGTAGAANWAANDQDVKTQLNGTDGGKFNTIVHGDIWLDWVEYSGRFRAQLAGPDVERLARYAMNNDPGLGSNGALENCYLKGPDGTPARTEAAATVKMQGAGFTVLKNEKQAPYIRAGRTRAPSTSQLTSEPAARAALECARVMKERATFYENSSPALAASGQLRDAEKGVIERRFQADLDQFIVTPVYASAARATILGITTVGGEDTLSVKAVFQRLANIRDVNITVFVTNDVTIVEGS